MNYKCHRHRDPQDGQYQLRIVNHIKTRKYVIRHAMRNISDTMEGSAMTRLVEDTRKPGRPNMPRLDNSTGLPLSDLLRAGQNRQQWRSLIHWHSRPSHSGDCVRYLKESQNRAIRALSSLCKSRIRQSVYNTLLRKNGIHRLRKGV